MKLCRFNTDRLGVIETDTVIDVSRVLEILPATRWARRIEDPVIANLDAIRAEIDSVMSNCNRIALSSVLLESPVATPSKIIGAPVNYHAHLDEAREDQGLHQGRHVYPIDEIGCFLKANSAMCGHGSTIARPFDDARIDHEAEVAIVIGKPAHKVSASDAMNYIAGYSLALDMTVRGKQDRSLRKSCDGFAVLGPWFVTADEIRDPGKIGFALTVNGEERQNADTSLLIRSMAELIEMCSDFYTLLPGDVIMTGTPEGVSPVAGGDVIEVTSEELGTLQVTIA